MRSALGRAGGRDEQGRSRHRQPPRHDRVGEGEVRLRVQDGGAGLFGGRPSMCRTSIPTICSTSRRRWRSSPASPTTAASWCRAITAPASRPISSRSRRASTGPACASISTAMSAASTSSARTRSSSRTASRSPNSATASCPGPISTMSRSCFDEYDAGRPDVMFVIQRVLESSGRLTLLDQSRVIRPHPAFRLFATANTVGLGDTTGLYHGTQQINQAQMDRWSIVTTLNYLPHDNEVDDRARQGQALSRRQGPRDRQQDGARRRHDALGLHQWRPVDRDEPAHGHHLGRERRDLRRCRLCVPADLPQQVRRAGAPGGRRVLPARLRRGTARSRPPTWCWAERSARWPDPATTRAASRRHGRRRRLQARRDGLHARHRRRP